MSRNDQSQKKCMVESCPDPARWKGICGKCYHQARELIKDGKTTWEDLAEMGLCELPDRHLLTAFIKKTSGAVAGEEEY